MAQWLCCSAADLNGISWIPALAASFSMEAKILDARVLKFESIIKNPSWLKFPEPSTTMCLFDHIVVLACKTWKMIYWHQTSTARFLYWHFNMHCLSALKVHISLIFVLVFLQGFSTSDKVQKKLLSTLTYWNIAVQMRGGTWLHLIMPTRILAKILRLMAVFFYRPSTRRYSRTAQCCRAGINSYDRQGWSWRCPQ